MNHQTFVNLCKFSIVIAICVLFRGLSFGAATSGEMDGEAWICGTIQVMSGNRVLNVVNEDSSSTSYLLLAGSLDRPVDALSTLRHNESLCLAGGIHMLDGVLQIRVTSMLRGRIAPKR